MTNVKKTVVVGMSGGVDSSVVAHLLKEQGYRVIGLFMKNWDEADGPCPAEADYQDVAAVCGQIDIPHYSVNFCEEYWERVFQRCLEQFKAGETPNPDILCNREIKFDLFYKRALEMGADYVATGHYARVGRSTTGAATLLRGVDSNKDQSYFLYTLKSSILENVLFPLGELEKPAVRALASKYGLVTATKKDSTGICFIGKRPFREFLSQFLAPKPGKFETPEGLVVGEHEGAHLYTIGQRKGLKIGGAGDAWFVVGKSMERNVVTVIQGDDHPMLYQSEIRVKELSWVGEPPTLPLRCTAKVRYRTQDTPCTITALSEVEVCVRFDKPERAITPSQSIVFYQGETCLGGGFIC